MPKRVRLGFESNGLLLPVAKILPLRQLKPNVKNTLKYRQILASVREIGVVEPLVVYPQDKTSGIYLLLDGHLRLEVLKQLGKEEISCLISADDEAYTYNGRLSRVATIQGHSMILKTIKSGVGEDRIARTLDVDIKKIKEQRDLLNGICKEAADLLKNRHIPLRAFSFLKKMKPMRQIEVAELMIASVNFSVPYAKALLIATPAAMLLDPNKAKITEGLSAEQVSKLEKEMDCLQRDLRLMEESHGNAVLNLVVIRGYITKLLDNQRVTKYISQNHADIYEELRKIAQAASLEG